MSETTSNDSDPRAVDLATFIENHSALLVVMGVFAAVAVYISQSAPELGTDTDAELMYATGFISALGMTILFLLLVYKKLAAETKSWHNLHLAHYRLDNLPLVLFTLFNMMLVLSISYLITRYEPVVFTLVLVAAVFAGGGIVIRTIYSMKEFLPQSAWARIPVMFILSTITALASHFILIEYLSNFDISTIHELSLTEPVQIVTSVVPVLVMSIRGAAVLAVFVSILSIPVVALDKIRGKSPYDNTD